jgi:hypothetical protein
LCFALDDPRKEIIEGAYKGPIFEDFLYNLLSGELVVAIKPEDPLGGYVQRTDDLRNLPGGIDLLDMVKENTAVLAWEKIAGGYQYYTSKPIIPIGEEHTVMSYTYLGYDYCLPPNQTNCQIVIRKDQHPSFVEFLKKENVTEWEEDLLLLHKNKPKHCLVAQAKFTRKYAHKKYCAGRNHVLKFANYIEGDESAFRTWHSDGYASRTSPFYVFHWGNLQRRGRSPKNDDFSSIKRALSGSSVENCVDASYG